MNSRLPSRYQVKAVLGAGGSGQVFHAYDRDRNHEVAVKVVGEAESDWLRREFDTLRQIRHENLVQVFDWSVLPDGSSCYSMELIAGGDLGQSMGVRMPPDQVRRVLGGVLRGLAHLHCHGEIHGDLKPSNVLLTGGELVKVSDVGMGKAAGSVGGTPGFAAPELWTGAEPSLQSDIYAVGVIAFEALTGVHPFKALAVRDVVSGQLHGWVPSPSAYGVVLPPDLERAIMRSLERDPQLRQASADEFLEGIGLGNNPGEIIGGRFVDRSTELLMLSQFARANEPGSPTLLYLVGPRGIGKSAVLNEFALALGREEFRVLELRSPERDLAELALGTIDSTSTHSLSQIADKLIVRFQKRPALLVEDPSTEAAYVRDAARYVWAEATERNTAATVRFLRTVEARPPSTESFETCVDLTPFGPDETERLLRGLLGTHSIEKDIVRRIVDESGGLPGSAEDLVLDLVARRLITRRFGKWQALEIRDTDWGSASTSSTRWTRSWERLSDSEKDVLAAVALIQGGATLAALEVLLVGTDIGHVAGRLQAVGWLVPHRDGVRVVSREAERIAMSQAGAERIERLRSSILTRLGGALSRPDRARLLIQGPPCEEAVSEGLWLGAYLKEQRQYSESLSIFTSVRDAARALGNLRGAQGASLGAAEGYQLVGMNDEVIRLLTDPLEWSERGVQGGMNLGRLRLLGLAYKGKSEVSEARAYLSEYSQSAERSKDHLQRLAAEAELAEVTWRHGGGSGRVEAASRIRTLMNEYGGDEKNTDEWAALLYQLGAILVVDGRRGEALPILTKAVSHAKSRYWQMRIKNALAAAHYYLGNFRTGLSASDEAWECAVEGEIDSFKPRILAGMAAIRAGLAQFREAADLDLLSSHWGRRIGSPFEFEAGLLGAASNLIHLGEYEKSIRFASQAREVALAIPSPRDVSKSYEIESLALIQVGNWESAEERLRQGRTSLEQGQFDDVIPRLCWHEARIEMHRGRPESAENKLTEALSVLEKTQDWEDLPSVRIEIQRMLAGTSDRRLNLSELQGIIDAARSKEIGLIQLRGTLALIEILFSLGRRTLEQHDLLMEGLRLAERAGANEYVWRLSYWIACNLREAGDERGASSRLGNALRVLRELAGALSPPHRSMYLNTVHARQLMKAAEVTG